jgi:hypothetical protein
MNPGDVVRIRDKDHLVVADLGEKIVVTSAAQGVITELKAVPRHLIFDMDPD